jgi:peptide/histidine transporter 3/4
LYISDSWFPKEMNKGKAEYLLFLLGILMFVDFVIFIFVAKRYTYKKIQTQETYEPITIAAVGEKQEPPAYHNLGYSDENYQTKL